MKYPKAPALVLRLAIVAAVSLSLRAFAAPGDLYVSDSGSGTIYKFTPAGIQSTFVSGLNSPAGLAFDRVGNLFVVEGGTGSILKFTSEGTRSTSPPGFPALSGSPLTARAISL